MKGKFLYYIFVVLITAIAGEIKIIPFGEDFRVALGSAAFFFMILWFRQISVIIAGLLTGIFVPFFRMGLDMLFENSLWFEQSFSTHWPAFFYYFLFAFFLQLIGIQRRYQSPFLLGLVGAISDFLANSGELVARRIAVHSPLEMEEFITILVVGIIRSYFVVGLYSNYHLKGIRMIHEEKEKRMLKLLNIGSGLYQEALYLQKSMGHIEQVTSKSYELYRLLKRKVEDSGYTDKEEWQYIVKQSLKVSQEIHEVKKNSQRILAGLLKMFKKESLSGNMNLREIINFSIKANQNYAEMLNKTIHFNSQVHTNLNTSLYYPILSVINNLLANAVEAIHREGKIELTVFQTVDNKIEFQLKDTGVGIDQEDNQIIFEPGYTTKFDQAGVAATGIGLSHVKDIVLSLKGEVLVRPLTEESGTVFIVRIPRQTLEKEGEENES